MLHSNNPDWISRQFSFIIVYLLLEKGGLPPKYVHALGCSIKLSALFNIFVRWGLVSEHWR